MCNARRDDEAAGKAFAVNYLGLQDTSALLASAIVSSGIHMFDKPPKPDNARQASIAAAAGDFAVGAMHEWGLMISVPMRYLHLHNAFMCS